MLVFELVRRRRLLERYALLWLFSSAVLLGAVGLARRCSRSSPTRGRDLLRAVGAVRGRVRLRARAAAALLARDLAPRRADQGARPAHRPAPARGRRAAQPARRRRGRPRRERRPSSPRTPLTALAVVIVAYESARATCPATLARAAAAAARRTTSWWSSTTRRRTTRPRRGGRRARAAARAQPSASPAAATPARRRPPRRCCSSSTPTRGPPPGCLDALRAAADAHPDWGAWQALVTLPGRRARSTRAAAIVHWLGFGWAGGYGEPRRGRRPRSRARSASPRARRSSCGARRGTRPAASTPATSCTARTSTCRCGCGSRAGASASVPARPRRARLRVRQGRLQVVPPRAQPLVDGARRLSRGRCWRCSLPALLASELALLAVAARGGWLRAKLRAQLAVLRSLPWALRRRRAVQAGRRDGADAFAARAERVARLAVPRRAPPACRARGRCRPATGGRCAGRSVADTLRIGFLGGVPPAMGGGGLEVQMRRTAAALEARGHSVVALASAPAGADVGRRARVRGGGRRAARARALDARSARPTSSRR